MNHQAKSISLQTIERNRRWSKWTLGLLVAAGCLVAQTSRAYTPDDIALAMNTDLVNFRIDAAKAFDRCEPNPYSCSLPYKPENTSQPKACIVTNEVNKSLAAEISACKNALSEEKTVIRARELLRILKADPSKFAAALADAYKFNKNTSDSATMQWQWKERFPVQALAYTRRTIFSRVNSEATVSKCESSLNGSVINCHRDYLRNLCDVINKEFAADANLKLPNGFLGCVLNYDQAYQTLINQTNAAITTMKAKYGQALMAIEIQHGDPLLVKASGAAALDSTLFTDIYPFGVFTRPVKGVKAQGMPSIDFTPIQAIQLPPGSVPPGGATAGGPTAPNLPGQAKTVDIAAQTPELRDRGGRKSIYACFRNSGIGDAAAFSVKLQGAPLPQPNSRPVLSDVAEQPIAGLATGATSCLDFALHATNDGKCMLYAVFADPQNKLNESNRTNNSAEVKVACKN
jgi:hypothetical protein